MTNAHDVQFLPEELLHDAPAPGTIHHLFEEVAQWEVSESVWRGQSRPWAIHPGAARVARPALELLRGATSISVGRLAAVRDDTLLAEGRSKGFLTPGGSDLHDLAVLQHYGAATSCLDATTNLIVALWFAVNDHPKEDGLVVLLPRGNPLQVDGKAPPLADLRASRELYSFAPPASLPRALVQQSVLLFAELTDSPVCSLPIDIEPPTLLRVTPELKENVKTGFRELFGLHEGALFPDLPGFCAQYSAQKSWMAGPVGEHALRRLFA